jgi:hypothetical protein
MGVAQLGHEGFPHQRPAFFEQLRANRELGRGRQMAAAPRTDVREHGKQLDRRFGQAVDRLLLVAGVVGASQQPALHQFFKTIGQDVGGDSLLRV